MCLSERWLTEDCDAGQFDVLVEADVAEAVDEVDEFSQVVEERLVCLLRSLLHELSSISI